LLRISKQEEADMRRIAPLEPPYTPEVEAMVGKWMGPARDREPLELFRILAVHSELAARMGGLGGLLLGRPLIDAREREIVIHRTTARCDAEYEWGVHAVVFGPRVGLSERELAATVRGDAVDPVWSERDALLVRLCDELHDDIDVSDELWVELERHWSHAELLELIVTAGWYRLISQIVRAARIEAEPWAARFPATQGQSSAASSAGSVTGRRQVKRSQT
jgi:4-carboxymuconolactone decarboxylase